MTENLDQLVEQEAVKQAVEEIMADELKKQAEAPETPYNPNEQLQWRPDDKITITGMEFYTFQRFAEFFEPLLMAKNSVLARMVQSGVAKRVVPESKADETKSVITEDNQGEQKSKIVPINKRIEVVK